MDPQGDTREKLIAAALHLFGQQGYAATTTRAIAARAGTNIGLIAYHFGGKPQLRQACAEAVVQRMKAVTHDAADHVETPDEAARVLEMTLTAMLTFLVANPDSEDVAAFVLRELSENGAALDLLYDTLLEPRHRDFCRLWGMATGQDPDHEDVRLAVFAMLGQAVYFRIGRRLVERRMGWSGMGSAEAGKIARIVRRNLRAELDRSSAR